MTTRVVPINTTCNPYILTLNESTGGATIYSTRAAFPTPGTDTNGTFAIAEDTGIIYCGLDSGWCPMLVLVPDGL